MTRLPLIATALATALHLGAAPLAAQTAPTAAPMTDEERAAFGAAVREYLLSNPEVIFEAVAEYERRTAQAQTEMDGTLVEINADAIFRDGHSWVGGNLDGDITLVEFMDYQCGFCRRAFPQINDFLQNDGNVRLIIKEFPILGPTSDIMARFAVSVLQNGTPAQYEEAHERLTLWDGEFTQTSARLLAEELGLDPDVILDHMGSDAVSEVLRENRELAQRLQITGTPTFVMGSGAGGEMLRGYLPSNELQRIASELRG